MGTPYAVSSDLVSAYPAKSLAIAQYIDGFKADLAMVQNAQTGTSYTFALTDFTKLLTLNNAAAVAVTVPLEATVAWPTGTQLRLLNIGAGTVTVAGAVGVTINGTPLTLAQYKGAILTKTGTNTWVFLPFSGGSAPAVISSTTGSPTITTDSTATYYKFTGSGTMVVGTGGAVEVLVVAGGGGGGSTTFGNPGGGGAGGMCTFPMTVTAGTIQITVGAGGVASSPFAGADGGHSAFGTVFASGGGGGGAGANNATTRPGNPGGSGGGGGYSTSGSAGGAALSFQGNAGGAANLAGGGGGGAGAVGQAGSAGGAGGTGLSSSVGGSAVTYAAGGPSFGSLAGANTGNGGGGGTPGQTGGTGVVIVKVLL